MEQLLIGALIKYGGQVGQNTMYILMMGWCIMKISALIKKTNAISDALKKKVEEKDFVEKVFELKQNIGKMEKDNKVDHEKLFASSTEQLRILSFLEGRLSNGKKID
jgi:hypothetical protein